ncbi:hypothetical protein [Kineococcus glutinatus]|uniref:Uncharacterized protein n=1 Tax=Kineococcus glutinatus TaxID=1070872 RepID=A0ABP9HGY7_9ACTN
MPTIGELGKTLLDNIGVVLRGGPDQPLPPQTFLTWCRPGIPLMPEDLDFAENGIFSAQTAEGQKMLANHAFSFANLMDYIPSVGANYDNAAQEASYAAKGGMRLSEMYHEILKASKVVHHELTEEEQARLKRCRDFLETTTKVQDLMSGEMTEQSQPSAAVRAYDNAMAEWLIARTNRGNKLAAAQAATGAAGLPAVADWNANHEVYEMQLDLATRKWAAEGYRNMVDQARAIIDQTTLRNMALWKQSLLERYAKGRVAHIDSGSTFPYTTLVPGNVAKSRGWTTYTHTHEHRSISTHQESTTWNAGAGVGFGLWSFGANASGESHDMGIDVNTNSFTLSVELAQAVVVRPWFYPEFFVNRGWTLRPGDGWNFDGVPSDGANPPSGLLVGFPTQVILARNLTITSEEFASSYDQASSRAGGGGSVGWGPFRLSGGYSHSESSSSLTVDRRGASITSNGMQILGFVNHMLGKTPDPLPSIPATDFA